MLLCSVLVLATFSASGHLHIGAPNADDPAAKRAGGPTVVKLDPARREAAALRVTGSIVDTMGFLLAGAEVAAGPSRVRTDADGRFQIEVPRSPRTELSFAATGHRPAQLWLWPQAGEPVVAALEPQAPWDPPGPVVDAAAAPNVKLIGEGVARTSAGAPLAGALVVVAETMAMARTDDVGRFEIALPDGPATLIAHKPEGGEGDRGFAGRAAPFTPPRAAGRVPLPDLVAGPAVVLRGTVRDGAGQPQKGVPLQIVGDGFARAIASGDGGAFHVAGLLPGDYQLRAAAFRGALGSSRTVSLQTTSTVCELQLRAVPERRLRIVTEGGDPVARAVVATTVDGLRREVVRSDDAGYVHIRSAGAEARFDVRTGADYRPMRVVAPPETDGRLIVALP